MGTIQAERSLELRASAAEVYAVLADVEAYPDWQGDVKRATVLDRDGGGLPARAEVVQDAKVRTVRVLVRYRHEVPSHMSWQLEEGDVKAMDGGWRLEDLGDGRVRVTYALEVDPGRALGLLLRGPVVQRVSDHVLDGTLSALRERVER